MKKKKDYIYILLILITTIILLSKLFINPRYRGHDTIFHTGNIIYLSKTISFNNILGANIIKLKANPLGYGTWLFYPKLPHLLAAYIYLICKNIYLSMNIIYFITTFLSGLLCFKLSKKIFNNNEVAIISSIIYLSFSYHLCDIYIRDAFTENFMFFIIPLIFLGLFELKDDNIRKFYLFFILGYIIGIYSHLISMIFCTIFTFLFLIYYRKYFLKKEKIRTLIISTVIVTCICLPFITSILEHKTLGDYIVFSYFFSSVDSTSINTMPISKLFINKKNIEYNNIVIYLNYITCILILITTFIFLLKKNKKLYIEERKLLYFSTLIFITLICSKIIWNHLPSFLSTIQFPWRIMAFLSLTISLYSPMLFLIKNKYLNKKTIPIIMTIILITSIGESYNSIFYYKKETYKYKEIVNSTKMMGWQTEYLPIRSYNILAELMNNNISSLYKIKTSKNCKATIIEDNFPTIKFKIEKKEDLFKDKSINEDIPSTLKYLEMRNAIENSSKPYNGFVELPRIYYLGYKLKTNNNTIPVYETIDGKVGTTINKEGIYTLTYERTIFDKISRTIRTITIIILIVLIIKIRSKRNDNKI